MTGQRSIWTDERDLAIINAIQVNPRAPWARIGTALDIDADTAARRWARLVADGSAWLTVDPGVPRPNRMYVAFIEVDCVTDQAVAAGMALARHPGVAMVEHVTGDHDLCLMLYAADLPALSDFLLNTIARVPGVLATRSYLGTQMFMEGSSWQLGSLAPDQQRTLRGTDQPVVAGKPIEESDLRELVRVLSADCRMSISDLAAGLGTSRPTARRRLETALANRQFVIRCDVSRTVAGTPIGATLRTVVPPEEFATITHTLAAMPATRFLAGLTGGPSNLLLAYWLRNIDEIHEVEVMLAKRFPSLHVQDRVIALRTIKLGGRILDPAGQATAQIILDPWDMAERHPHPAR